MSPAALSADRFKLTVVGEMTWLCTFKTKAFGRKDVISFDRGGIHDTVALHN